MSKTKGERRAQNRKHARAKMRNRDVVGQGKMLGNVVRRGYGASIPDGRPVNYFEIGTDPESCPEAAEEYARNVYRSLSGKRS